MITNIIAWMVALWIANSTLGIALLVIAALTLILIINIVVDLIQFIVNLLFNNKVRD